MNRCICQSDYCKGEVLRYSIYPPSENILYPNRFWGVADYCKYHADDDVKNGFTLNEVSMGTHLATL